MLEPLLAIADLAEGEWPERARRAFVALRAEQAESDDETVGVRLLFDVHAAFEREKNDRISTERLLELLVEDEEAPWSDWRGKPITARGLAGLLRPFRIKSATVRFGDGTTAKGYKREQFVDVWTRYPPPTGSLSVTSVTTAWLSQEQPLFYPSQDPDVTDNEEAANPHEQRVVTDVTDRTPFSGEREVAEGHPGPGDKGYLEHLFAAFEAGLISEGEWKQADRAHRKTLNAKQRRVRTSPAPGAES